MKLYSILLFKRTIEHLLLFPFVVLGKAIARLKPLKDEYDLFCFFPIYGMGGAEKVNADIIATLPDKKIIIFFTKKSPDKTTLHLFQKEYVTIKDISKYTHKAQSITNFVYRGICAGYINMQKKKPVVFVGQCNFGYKVLPHLKASLKKVDLLHTSDRKFNNITFPYINYLDQRVVITDRIKADLGNYYRWLGVPEKYLQRIQVIYNSVPFPEEIEFAKKKLPLKIYYAGRGGHQKRLDRWFGIAARCIEENLPLEFHLAGNFRNEIPEKLISKIEWHGEIKSMEAMYELHTRMDVLMLTSAFEGLPLVVMEAMSCGNAILSTAVDAIPDHIKDSENGFLIYSGSDDEIIRESVEKLKLVLSDLNMLMRIFKSNRSYMKQNFSWVKFEHSYRNILVTQAHH